MPKIRSQKDFDRVANGVIEAANRALKKSLQKGRDHAVKLAPVDTGRLRGSITWVLESDLSGNIGTNVEYAIYQEFGTARNPPHPFLIPGWMHARKVLKRELKKEMKNTLKNL